MSSTHELILRIYDTAVDPAAWSDVLEEVAHHCGAIGAFVFEMHRGVSSRGISAIHYSARQLPEAVDEYVRLHQENELHDQDYFAEMSQRSDKIELISDAGLDSVYQPTGGLEEQPHIKVQRHFGFKSRAGALLNKDDYYRDRFALVYREAEPFAGPEAKARTELLMPHIAKALDVTRPTARSMTRFAGITDAIDNLNVGVCIISSDRSIVFQNGEFSRQLEAYSAMSRAPDGRLVFSQNSFGAELTPLLGDASGHGHHGARPRKEAVATAVSAGEHTLCIEILPLSKADAYGEAHLDGHVIYSLDTSRSYQLRTDMISRLFELSKSETAVLELMADGLTNQQIAEQRIKSIHTINTQVKALLAKMQAANRSQVIRLATNLSASLRM